ncbi:uncharacterized protein METZ01_LOCUS265666, partial [marine metagenome]
VACESGDRLCDPPANQHDQQKKKTE